MPETPPSYRLTDLTPEQRSIVANLRLGALVDEDRLHTSLHPRNEKQPSGDPA